MSFDLVEFKIKGEGMFFADQSDRHAAHERDHDAVRPHDLALRDRVLSGLDGRAGRAGSFPPPRLSPHHQRNVELKKAS